MKRVQIFLVLLFIAIAGVIAWQILTKPQEPVYQGKTVDAWLDDMTNSYGFTTPPRDPEYCDALGHMGAKAVPFIFHRLEQNDSPLINGYRNVCQKLPGFLRKCLPKSGPIAFDASRAGAALICCGSDAIPLITNKLNSRNPAVREAVWGTIQRFAGNSISTNETISLCLPALKDKDAAVRLYAAMSLGRIGAAASNAEPALASLLSSSEAGRRSPSERIFVHANTALALGQIGPAASNAIPALTNLMATGDNYACMLAAVALWQITSNENIVLPAIIKELPSFDINSLHLPVNTLKEMGPSAKAAFPLLLSKLTLAVDENQREAITNALKAIDPDAAAKAGIK